MKQSKKTTNQLHLDLEMCDKMINIFMQKDKKLLKKTIKQIIKDTGK